MDANMKALKLDATYRPIEVIDAIEALVMCIVGKATPVENYETSVSSAYLTFKVPAVIVLKTIVKFKFHSISCNRHNIIIRDKNECQYCGISFASNELTIDHIFPKSRGGDNTWENLVAACKKCNQKKGCRTPQEANMKMLRPPKKPKTNLLKNITNNQRSDLWNNYLWEKNVDSY
jgi:5-methylcytosine-specific restriction endonuclease McrA